MNHTFTARALPAGEHFDTRELCIHCSRPELDHGDDAQCEVCSTIASCELTKSGDRMLLMCAVCKENEARIDKDVAEARANRTPQENRISELAAKLLRDEPVTEREYHVKEITSIVAVEKQLIEMGEPNPDFALANLIMERKARLEKIFFDAQKTAAESKAGMQTDQKYLNMLVPKLREEERAKFKEYDITYKPTVTAPIKATARAPKMSATDRMYESAAKQYGLSVEQYKLVLAQATMQVTGATCTCKETPGLCRVHPK